MAKDNLSVEMSQPLREALGIPADMPIDYFTLLGLARENKVTAALDQAILERSKALRKWQTSPQYGAEAIKLLTMLHRAGKILKDPLRRAAYIEQFDRAARGDRTSSREEFTGLVRAALADNILDVALKRQLADYARQCGLEPSEAQRIIARVRDELEAARKAAVLPSAAGAASESASGFAGSAAAADQQDGWEFRIAEEGEEGFKLMMFGMESSGTFDANTPAALVAQAGKYGMTPQRATQLITDFQKERFELMVKRVAGRGVLSDNQARLLLAKTPAYGLEQDKAYEILSEYTLSMNSADELAGELALTEVFVNEEIEHIVEQQAAPERRRSLGDVLSGAVPDWARNLLLLVIVGAALVGAIIWAKNQLPSRRNTGVIAQTDTPAAVTQNTDASNPPVTGGHPPATNSTPAPAPDASRAFIPKPDPISGLLAFKPERPGDPSAFEMAIAEVTNAEYATYLRATLDTPPAGWNGPQYPAGAENLPVTNISWQKAASYCLWLAGERHWDPQTVGLPSHAEFLRALRGKTTRGEPLSPGYWQKAGLGSGQPTPSRRAIFDKIYVTPMGSGQIYDLLGNAAEWSRDEKGTQHGLLGGDYQQSTPDFDPLKERFAPPTTASPTIGFRWVHRLQ